MSLEIPLEWISVSEIKIHRFKKALFPFVYTLLGRLKCFTITGQTHDVDKAPGQVQYREELDSLRLKWKISSGIESMTVI